MDDAAQADDARKGREFFVDAPMKAALALQKALPIDEVAYRGVLGHGQADTRAYLLYGALDEVIKASVAGLRSLKFLDGPNADKDGKHREHEHVERLIIESLIDEQQMWARKLSETLVDLVHFTKTNDQDFYRLYLLCKRLDAYVALQRDFEEFFGCRNANADSTIDLLLNEINQLQGRIDVTKAWFLTGGMDFRTVPPPGRIFRSIRQRFLGAYEVASAALRLVLGVSYETGYASPSRSVHPNVGGPTYEFTLVEANRYASRIGLLGLHIVTLAHELSSIEPTGEAKQVTDSLKGSEAPAMFQRVHQRALEVGDIVFAYGDDLCQVVDVAKSKYGNTSYKVRYLVRPMIEGIEEDCFPSQYIRLLYRRRDIKREMAETLRRMAASGDEVAMVEGLEDEEVATILAKTFIDLEKRGALRLMLRAPTEEE